jgi:hypothetical protein
MLLPHIPPKAALLCYYLTVLPKPPCYADITQSSQKPPCYADITQSSQQPPCYADITQSSYSMYILLLILFPKTPRISITQKSYINLINPITLTSTRTIAAQILLKILVTPKNKPEK